MAVLKLVDAIAARVTQEVDPIVAALNVYLASPRIADYFSNPLVTNHVVFFGATEKLVGSSVVISEASKAGLVTAIEAAGWKEATVVYNESTKTLEIAFAEKVTPVTPPVTTQETPAPDENE